jgi:Zn-dependent protease with chaperone function
MDFFTHQDVARKKTSLLVFYFFVATALIVMAVYWAVVTIFVVGQAKMSKPRPGEQVSRPIGPEAFWQPQLLLWVTGGTVAVIALGTLYKTSSLRGGGETVARMLGGRPIDPSTRDLDERMLLNVVEEMAIAAGTPVPPVFVMDEESGINAFAAGWSPNDAVIGVTRGTIETLTRDELQGVIAHEFSHILNGDMRLNIRLIGILHGILLIALIGYGILRSMRHARFSSGSNKKGGGAALIVAMLALGVAFLIIGYVGVFFGKLIKSAVSRQREFLADASAVQFTRNPGGISGALKKIGGFAGGSRVKDEMAEEASHMFFGNALRASFLNMMSTHPPLDVRIKRIEPTFDGEFPEVNRVRRTARDLHREDLGKTRDRQAATIRARAAGKTPAEARAAAFAFAPAAAVASIGTLDAEHVDYAAGLVASIPERLTQAVHEPLGAVATVYCLLLDDDAIVRRVQLQSLADHADRPVYQEVQRLIPVMDQVAPESRLPLIDMAIPALCQMSGVQYRKFCETVHQMVHADEKINLFEFALERVMTRHLAPHFVKRKPPTMKYAALRPLLPTCSCLLSTLAHAGNRNADAAARAHSRGAGKLGRDGETPALLPLEQCSLKTFDQALDRLAQASPQIKKRVLEACAECIDSDGRVTIEEAELLRVVADSLDCPMPPLLADQHQTS